MWHQELLTGDTSTTCSFHLGTQLTTKCLYRLKVYNDPRSSRFISVCAMQHFLGIDSSFLNYRIVEVDFGMSLNGVIVLVSLQSSCGSPLFGEYIGSVTPEHFWITITIRGKELMIDRQGPIATYPPRIHSLFRSAPVEDYNKDICEFLCKNHKKTCLGNHIMIISSIHAS